MIPVDRVGIEVGIAHLTSRFESREWFGRKCEDRAYSPHYVRWCRTFLLLLKLGQSLRVRAAGLIPMSETEIPKMPLRVSVTSLGWMPDVALHRYRRIFLHESSYASLVIAAALLSVALFCCFLPWDERLYVSGGLAAKYVLAVLFLVGSAACVAVFFLRNHFGQRLVIDPITRKVTLRKTRAEAVLHWLIGQVIVADRVRHGKVVSDAEKRAKPEPEIVLDFSDVIGIQICGGPPLAYQVNLVFRTSLGAIDRDCLANHVVKRFCTNLAQQYHSEFGFPLIDNVESSREARLAGNRARYG